MKKLIIISAVILVGTFVTRAQDNFKFSPESYVVWKKTGTSGKETVAISTPVIPPKNFKMPVAEPGKSAVLLTNVPAYDWSFGCSATAAAMMAGYYDNNGYPSVYTGPANGGVAPLNNSMWGSAWINGEERKLCPLSATRQNLDGRTNHGHVDDYWVVSGHTGPDPYISNGWTQHTYDDCTGDFMKTNQAAFGNSDGSTTFVYYVDGGPYGEVSEGDGCYGLKLFFESRGCQVMSFYNQYIYGFNGNTKGFTFEQYCDMIDRGRPVLIQVSGHTMLGMGYDASTQLVYLHDTWDYSMHQMTWGDSYAGMQHYGVGVIEFPCDAVGELSEEFTYSSFPACWQQSSGGAFNWNRWFLSYANAAGGSPNEMQINWTEGIGVARLISAPVDLSGTSSVDLSFITYYDDWGPGATIKIQSSADLVNWTDEGWVYPSGSGDLPSGTIITAPVTHNLTAHTYIAWVLDGDHYQIDSWTIDNVSLYTSSRVSIKAYLQGPFNGATMNTSLNPAYLPLAQPYNIAPWNYSGSESVASMPNPDIVDWILVEFRDAVDAASALPSTVIARSACFLLKDGSIVDLDGISPVNLMTVPAHQLFVVLNHRNHLSVMSSGSLTQINGTYNWDFTGQLSNAYLNGQSQIGTGIYGMTAGDCDANNTVEPEDVAAWGMEAGKMGYTGGDLNLDSQVNNPDKNDKWYPNIGETSQVPSGVLVK